MRKPKIGILTTFTGADFGYSLVHVVHVQLQMLLKAEYAPVLFVAPSFKGDGVFSDKVIEIRRHIQGDAKQEDILTALRPMISDIDVMFCHDLLFLGQHKEWAEALRVLAVEYPHIAWLHWQHSRGDHSPVESMERSWFCYPNLGDLGHVATINSTDMAHVRYIPHPLDFRYMNWPELAIRIAEDYEFPFADVSMVMPARLDRQKQIDKLVRVFAGLKLAGRSVCLLVADAFATGERFIQYKRECEALAETLGLTGKEFAFLGEKYEECRISTPHDVVKALLEMSNLFIQPSTAETSSLVVMEAALAGALVIINADFPPIHHLYNKALTLPFGSIFDSTKYYRNVTTADGKVTKVIDDQLFWNDRAKDTILPAMDTQLTLMLKKQQLRERWPSRVFDNDLTPLIMQAWGEVKAPDAARIHGDPEVTAIITTMDNLPVLKRQVPILLDECGRVIVVDQDSQDGTREWLDEQEDITVIHKENNGAGPGRNAGLAEWDKAPTAYTLMIDGGILPPRGGVRMMKEFLTRHPEIHVISPEVATCYTGEEAEATRIIPHDFTIADEAVFLQATLSSTAYCLCRDTAWVVRFCEDGPYGEPGWGVDDNDMSYRWNEARIYHRDWTVEKCPIKLFRRSSGSFQRLFKETGVWPNQYGSVYEKRNVKCHQDWPQYHDPLWQRGFGPEISFVIENLNMPELAHLVKKLHTENKDTPHEIIVDTDGMTQESLEWVETFRYRWPWGDTTFTPDRKKMIRGQDYPEELWTGDFLVNTTTRGKDVRMANA